ncbi:hypothetical protein ACHAXS_003961 [Conticribra weissflogii]
MDTFGNDLSSGGQVLSRAELLHRRQRNGECLTCGTKLFKKKLLSKVPLTIPGKVLDGRCLSCQPLDPSKGEELVASCVAVSPGSAGGASNPRGLSGGSGSGSGSSGFHRNPSGGRSQPSQQSDSQSRGSHDSTASGGGISGRSASTRNVRATPRQLLANNVSSSMPPSRQGGGAAHSPSVTFSESSSSTVSAPNNPHNHHHGINTAYGRSQSSRNNNVNGTDNTSARDIPMRRAVTLENPPSSSHSPATPSSNQRGNNFASFKAARDIVARTAAKSMKKMSLQNKPSFQKDDVDDELEEEVHHSEEEEDDDFDDDDNDNDVYEDGHSQRSGNAKSGSKKKRKEKKHKNKDKGKSSKDEERRHNSQEEIIQRNSTGRRNTFLTKQMPRPSQVLAMDPEFLAYLNGLDDDDGSGDDSGRYGGDCDNSNTRHQQQHHHQQQQFHPSNNNNDSSNHNLESVTDIGESYQSNSSGYSKHSEYSNGSSNGSTSNNPNNNSTFQPPKRLSREERNALATLASNNLTYIEIINLMMLHSLSPIIQNEALHALSLIHDPSLEVLDQVSDSCGFEIIVSAMGSVADDPIAQTNACKVLFIASSFGEHHQVAIGNAGGIDTLGDAMTVFHDDMIVLEGCLLALSNLCIPKRNLRHFLAKSIVELTLDAMGKSVDNCGLQEHGCAVLANLAAHPGGRTKIRECGGCDTIVVSMVVNPTDVEVQLQALVALKNLCVRDDENKVVVANAGGIDAVIGAMQSHRNEAKVQEKGSWVLGILGMNEDNKCYIGENGGADVIVRAMFVHATNSSVQEKACRALWTLSVYPHNKYIIVEVGAIAAVIGAMQSHAEEASIQEKGCGVLSNIAANDDKLKVRIVQEGALDVIVMAMVLHGENETLQERACILIKKLCIPENVPSMVMANMAPMMAVAAEINETCREKAVYVMSLLDDDVT